MTRDQAEMILAKVRLLMSQQADIGHGLGIAGESDLALLAFDAEQAIKLLFEGLQKRAASLDAPASAPPD